MSGAGEATRPTRLGRYELITRIGEGGMAEVQLALQRGPAGFEKLVVVKLVHDNLASQKTFVDMLLDEARVAALVKHPNVVDIYDLGQAGGRFFIAMEYLEGEPLLAVLRAGREGTRLDPLSTGRLIADTAEGLDAAHELRSMSGERLELVHHDISLGNIVVLYNGQVKLVDFGVAKATQSATTRGKVQGKFSYMAPEKLKGSSGDRRSDIFSLGCVMWEALTLKRLFRGNNDADTMQLVLESPIQPPSKANPDVPAGFDPIVLKALARNPNRRYSSAKELAVEIEELLRVRGYGAKNDRIAKYMQETFKDHIDARKKLVQEVVSKGSASAEVVDAAFSGPELASGSPMPPADAIPEHAQWADSSRPTMISPAPAHPMFEERTNTRTVDSGDDTTVGSPLKAIWLDKRKRFYLLGGGTAMILLGIIAALATSRGSKHEPVASAAPPLDAATVEPVVVVTAPPDAAAVAEVTPPPDAAIEPEIEIDTPPPPSNEGSAKKPTTTQPVNRKPPPSINVSDTVNKATLAYVKGDTKLALELLQKARSAKPGFAPTYRVLGKVYKKLGDTGAAKKAFQKYVQLAPSASDVDQIREEIKKL